MDLAPTIKYLEAFFGAHEQPYREMMTEGKPARGAAPFDGADEIYQGIVNMVCNIEDNFLALSVPENYATPALLLRHLTGLRELADKQFQQTMSIINAAGGSVPRPVVNAHKINLEVREAIDYALSLSKEVGDVQRPPLARLRQIATRLPLVARQLLVRRKENGAPRSTLSISDEYDVQDLLRAVLNLEFDDVRPEEYCPSYAGSSTRTDFLLKAERIVIEVKKTRTSLKQKEVGNELTIDIAKYQSHPDCGHLFCLVWDTENLITNPVGLITDLEKQNAGFVTVVVAK